MRGTRCPNMHSYCCVSLIPTMVSDTLVIHRQITFSQIQHDGNQMLQPYLSHVAGFIFPLPLRPW